MRLALAINRTPRITAAVDGPGYLSAHVIVHDRPKENDFSRTVNLTGIQTLDTETVFLDWQNFDLHDGDSVELHLLDDGEGDPPSSTHRSSESPRNLFSHPELAKELVALVSDFEARLMQFVAKSEKSEPAEEHRRFTTAVARVVAELGDSFLYPVYRRHKELVPDELKGGLL